MHPNVTKNLVPFWVPNFLFEPSGFDALVGFGFDIDLCQPLVQKLIFDPRPFFCDLIDKLFQRTRGWDNGIEFCLAAAGIIWWIRDGR